MERQDSLLHLLDSKLFIVPLSDEPACSVCKSRFIVLLRDFLGEERVSREVIINIRNPPTAVIDPVLVVPCVRIKMCQRNLWRHDKLVLKDYHMVPSVVALNKR